MYVSDPVRSYALTPGFDKQVMAGYPFHVSVNSRGYRDDEWGTRPGFRVLVAGNSYVFGIGLAAKDRFTAYAGRDLAGSAQFYNAGVPSYGIPHSLETIRRECPVVQPRHVIYAYDFNDSRLDHMVLDSRSVVDGYLLANWADDRKTRLKLPLSPQETARQIKRLAGTGAWRVSDSLRLYNIRKFLAQSRLHPRQLAEKLALSFGYAGHRYFDRYLETRGPAFSAPATIRKAARLIGEMKAVASKCGAKFSLMILPNETEAYYGLREPAVAALKQALGLHGIDVLDMRKYTLPGRRLARAKSGYYSAGANRLVATRLVEHLRALYPGLRQVRPAVTAGWTDTALSNLTRPVP